MASVIGASPGHPGEGTGRSSRRDAKPVLFPYASVHHAEAVAVRQISDDEVARFAPLAVTLEAHELLVEVDRYLNCGFSAERIFIELLAPAARLLGEDWTSDRLDFLDVTMALWRLQEVLREVAARTGCPIPLGGRRVLFAPLPGDQHSFGTAMIDECFTRAGWSSTLLIEPSRASLLATLAAADYDLVGLTVTNDCHIGPLTSLIVAIRSVSRNPNVRVMLGGRLLIEDPTIARLAGADGTAPTALDALELAERLVAAPVSAVYA